MSWDDASSGRSQDDSPSVVRMNVGFDNPTPMRSLSRGRRTESYDALQERLMALNEVRGGCVERKDSLTVRVCVYDRG